MWTYTAFSALFGRFILFSSLTRTVMACSNVLVTPGASEDGSMIAYNADMVTKFGSVYHYPPTSGLGGTMRKVYGWDNGKYMGEIPEANRTYNVVGNANENGVAIGETTYFGEKVLTQQPGAIMDYGSLIYIALQRSTSAREAIHIITSLADQYGYASAGESFSIADGKEVWHMEMIGRGATYGKIGAVYVAMRIPDGYIGAHANQARITTFPRDDPENCLYAEDVVDVARHYGLYEGTDEDFSFSGAFNPPIPGHVRTDEARVWVFFSRFADTTHTFEDQYHEYAAGRDLSKRMPLFIKPYRKLTVTDIMHIMANHFEGTEFDASLDVGSGLYGLPYRPRPVLWDYKGRHYHIERNIATYRTGFTFVAQIRPWMPRELSAVSWFAVDDASTTPRVPFYACSHTVAEPYAGKGPQDGVKAPIFELNLQKAFWVQNLVSNYCYMRWKDAYPMVREKIDGIQETFLKQVAGADAVALGLYNKTAESAIDYVTGFSVVAANRMHEEWWEFFGELFVTYRDYLTFTAVEDEKSCGCKASQNELSSVMRERIVRETGDRYLVPTTTVSQN